MGQGRLTEKLSLVVSRDVKQWATLRTELEREWERPGVRFPNHLCRWSKGVPGYASDITWLWYSKGKKSVTKTKTVRIRR